MPKLRRLSGDEVIRIFEHFGFQVIAQTGSHVKLRRISPDDIKQTLTILRHKELDTGTLRAILRQSSRYISLDELTQYFYS
jgi:predicted RNA binding protein YcfA (HicA-like mRNA interferase family)